MFSGSIVVAGAGVSGLATSLLLARDGHAVELLERDSPAGAEATPEERRGVPHYVQPHALSPRARLELRESLPDVYDDLIAHGAWEVDLRPKLPGPLQDEDELLQYVAARRPLLESALRRAVLAEPRITWHRSRRVTELPEADLVVDALGRHTCLRVEEPETSDCGVVYYSRYYQQRPGFSLPDGPWLLGPRGSLGYFAFSTFPGDNDTFATLLAVPPGEPDWKALRYPQVYDAAVASIPSLAAWADPAGCDPLTGVLAMAGLRNVAPPDQLHPGYAAVGDALGHTDPVLAHGLAFALVHARAVRDAARWFDDVGDLAAAYLAAVRPELRERFDACTALDEQRLRAWRGGDVDLKRDYALFSLVAGGAVAAADPGVFRSFVRRIGLLDRTSVLDEDLELRESMERQFAALPRRALGPSRDEMVAIARAHA